MKVTVEPDGLQFRLIFHDDRYRPMPAGPRLFRQQPHPQISFSHSSHEAALRDAVTLESYLREHYLKRQSKTELRKQTL